MTYVGDCAARSLLCVCPLCIPWKPYVRVRMYFGGVFVPGVLITLKHTSSEEQMMVVAESQSNIIWSADDGSGTRDGDKKQR